jgi:hypothetical protein
VPVCTQLSADGFAALSGNVGVRASVQLTPKRFDKWVKAIGFVEGGGYANFRWNLVPFQLVSKNAGGYFRARVELGYWGGVWSTTHQYSRQWCIFGNCQSGGVIDVED